MAHKITRVLTLDAGHRVPDHKSKCRSLHGHTYRVECTFGSDVLAEEGAAKGMVADFGSVKTIMEQEIHEPCDHKTILYYEDPLLNVLRSAGPCWSGPGRVSGQRAKWGLDLDGDNDTRLHVVNFIPTAENLAEYWFHRIFRRLRETPEFESGVGFQIERIRVWETPNCFAEFVPDEIERWSAPAGVHRGKVTLGEGLGVPQ